jgi:hypothetical protein
VDLQQLETDIRSATTISGISFPPTTIMHLDLPHLTYSGPPIDDSPVLDQLPSSLHAALVARNGCLAYRGALHVRGACLAPPWHSLRSAMAGPQSFMALYPGLPAGSVPFAEDAFGDQFLLREDRVWHLTAETGEIAEVASSVEEFFDALLGDIAGVLGYEPARAVGLVGGELGVGQLISVYPPFVMDAGGDGRSFRAVDALDARAALAAFAAQIRDLPDGATVQIKVVP